MSIEQKYNTKAAALYRDKVSINITLSIFIEYSSSLIDFNLQVLKLAKGEQWSPTTSSAKDYNVDHIRM